MTAPYLDPQRASTVPLVAPQEAGRAPEMRPLDARSMVVDALVTPNADNVSDVIQIVGEDHKVIFRMLQDGTVEMPDPERVEEAAALFWRNVIALAECQGYKVRNLPEQPRSAEGWDA